MRTKPICYGNAWESPNGLRWIVASNPDHYDGAPEVLEIDKDESVTQYSYGGRLMPSVGISAKLDSVKPETTLKHVTNAKEREMVAHKEKLIERQKEMMQLQYDVAKLSV